MRPDIVIRRAQKEDVQALYSLIVALAEHHDQRHFLTTSVDTLERDGFLGDPQFGAILADDGKGLVGFASFTWNYSIWLGGKYMNIDDVFVKESHRGLGIGERLMLEAKEICAGAGGKRLRWEVQPDNQSAIRFYERLGARIRSKGVFSWNAF
jgi:ribosomal protein S18 acetylase RimI-like enzyme